MSVTSIIPIGGALTFIIGSGLTIYVDRLERLRVVSTPRPVGFRFFSQAILGLQQWPHWIFVATCTIFGPCLYATASWQATVLLEYYRDHPEEECPSIANMIRMDGALTAIFLYLDAWIPLGRPIITHIAHSFVAIGFFVMGTHYVYNTIRMVQILNDGASSSAIITIRQSLLGIMVLAGIGIALTTSPAIKAHGQILDHQYRGSPMEQSSIVQGRQLEAAMSTFQMILGICLGFDMMTAVVDIDKVESLPIGGEGPLLMFGIMLVMDIAEYLYRDRIFHWCQSMLLRFRTSKVD